MSERLGMVEDRTLGDIVRAALATAPLQILPECTAGVQACKHPRGASRVTFLTENLTPSEALYPDSARYVGVVVWVPRDIYAG